MIPLQDFKSYGFMELSVHKGKHINKAMTGHTYRLKSKESFCLMVIGVGAAGACVVEQFQETGCILGCR